MAGKIKRIAGGLRRAAYLVPRRPGFAQFEITNRCNLACNMCPRTKYYKVKIIDMDYEVFTRALDRLLPLRLATLTGWGEPLLHPRLYCMIAHCRERGVPAVSMTSNGVLFNTEHIKNILESGLTDLRISVDNYNESGDAYDATGHACGAEIMEKVADLRSLRTGPLPRMTLAVTIYPGNHDEVFNLIDRAAEIKLDSVAVMRMNDRFDESLKRYTFEEEGKICAEYEAAARKAGIKIGTPREFSHGLRRLLYRGGTKCPVTFDGVYVTAEGLITPCCALPKYAVGDATQCDIETIWNSDKFRKFRDVQRTVCTHCDLLDITYKAR